MDFVRRAVAVSLILFMFQSAAPLSAIDLGGECYDDYEEEMSDCAHQLQVAAIIAAGTGLLACLGFVFVFNLAGFLSCGLAVGVSISVMNSLVDSYENCVELAEIHYSLCLPCV